ncbi:MAG: arsenite efflux transporter metallochaperone ArsD [Dehalococcoidia bacterium]|nr:MAG: arsenite efflux transporter metallochaperone ArsD [Dehalococcoidia bacterium]
MNKKITIYEPTLCCDSGVCGPNPDQALITLQDTIDKAKEKGIETERFTITSHPKKFQENPEVIKLLQEKKLNALPITAFEGQIIKAGSYPTLDELIRYF